MFVWLVENKPSFFSFTMYIYEKNLDAFKACGEKKRPTSCKQINWLAPSNLLIRSFLDQKIKTLLRNGTFCLETGSKNIQIH